MLHHFNTRDMIDQDTEIHYRFHAFIDDSDFPQVHDFFELSLTTSGQMLLEAGDETLPLGPGSLVLIRPGVIHTKKNLDSCQYVNLAFPRTTMEAIFEYLGLHEELAALLALRETPCISLSREETLRLHGQMQSLSTLPTNQRSRIRAAIRRLLLDCMDTWFIPLLDAKPTGSGPVWLQNVVRGLDDPANLAQGLAYMVGESGVTLEHLCRTFQKYLGLSPGAYLTSCRLNYAANLLRHSDHDLIDIAYEVGFQSESSFYHNFKRQYGISPGRYRRIAR